MAYLIKNNLDILTGRKIGSCIFIMYGFKVERQTKYIIINKNGLSLNIKFT